MYNTPESSEPRKKNIFLRLLKWFFGTTILLVFISFLLVLSFRWINPPTSSYMIQQKYELQNDNGESLEIKYQWVGWDQISDYVKVAAITSEDQRFPEHNGFDFEAIEKALEESQRGDNLRGASTITQQVAKNMFLWPGRSFIRKGIEAYFTVLIELCWSKRRILEIYLNIAEFGAGVFGVEAAASTYFGIPASKLSMLQSALLITALPSPKRYNLHNPSPYMIKRRNWVLRYMHLLGNRDYLDRLEQ
ncbi:monofunctional biosynthetic peptidoglycan transglycosylase [Aliifodinibius sp. S!AR15-10]|uniref:monofunctional biosynthetic peptidoglycan transglycosylase n=1 Tax=Aliifodinibius sp. S!AR15-10 TaxID=2950437 RepID=UPI002866B5DB|nr:monofunctional biosynthetic peptidoglycan transglycosylase [Aliifodinibius sp. S!AR15-10]MDR8391079.1 monofunctional biosynthetic peptidoglycan transglycosylase [Aliifodinibius sp. S!AR15-10]